MIIGIKNASHLHQLEKVTIKHILFILLMVSTLTPQAADSLDFEMPVFSFTPKVLLYKRPINITIAIEPI